MQNGGVCKLTVAQLFKMAQLRVYTGPISTLVGSTNNFAFAISDQVPLNMYWVVLACGVMVNAPGISGGVASSGASLYVLLPGLAQPIPNNSVFQQYPLFLSYINGVSNFVTTCNGGPLDPAHAMRVDDQMTLDFTSSSGTTTTFEQNMLRYRKALILMEQQYLLTSSWINGIVIGSTHGLQLTLKVLIAELIIGAQDFEWI